MSSQSRERKKFHFQSFKRQVRVGKAIRDKCLVVFLAFVSFFSIDVMTTPDFDELLKHAGGFGRFQIIFFVLLSLPVFPGAFLVYTQVFFFATPDHWCRTPDLDAVVPLTTLNQNLAKQLSIPIDDDGAFAKCERYDVNFTKMYWENEQFYLRGPDPAWPRRPCGDDGWRYDEANFAATMVTENDIVCDKVWQKATSTAAFSAGRLVGNVLFGFVSDQFGRRSAFFIIVTMNVALSIATSFATDFVTFSALRTVNALTFPALFQIPFVMGKKAFSSQDLILTG